MGGRGNTCLLQPPRNWITFNLFTRNITFKWILNVENFCFYRTQNGNMKTFELVRMTAKIGISTFIHNLKYIALFCYQVWWALLCLHISLLGIFPNPLGFKDWTGPHRHCLRVLLCLSYWKGCLLIFEKSTVISIIPISLPRDLEFTKIWIIF